MKVIERCTYHELKIAYDNPEQLKEDERIKLSAGYEVVNDSHDIWLFYREYRKSLYKVGLNKEDTGGKD
ncbi:hypothetical protein MOE90_20245 [Bacillus spizizenii]|nr:hypothetical protein [Bacillus spizizenii]MCY9124974.1 hypothetical protein [Bacillus spizizenii]